MRALGSWRFVGTKSGHVTGGLLALLMVAAGPLSAPTSDVITLISPNEQFSGGFGVSVASAGDVNQDGFVDVIVGASQEEINAGRSYVFSGPDGSLLFELVSPNEEAHGSFGWSVAGAGDVNRDGFADLIVGANEESPGAAPTRAGRAYIFSGQSGSLLFELVSPNERANGEFGSSVAGAGDVDLDGVPDVIVGARADYQGSGPEGAGRAYIFSGVDASLLFELVSPNEEEFGVFGTSVGGAGDVNQDGFPDVIVGAEREDPGTSAQDAGRAYVFSGQSGNLIFELVSPNEEDNEEDAGLFGASVAGAGDVNRDGIADLIVGAPYEEDQVGRAYVFNGQNGSLLFELASVHGQSLFGGSVAGAGDVDEDGFADLLVGASEGGGRAYIFNGKDGSLHFELVSPNEQIGGGFGTSVAGAGDFNQDGVPDVIVGARSESPDVPGGAGRAYVFLDVQPGTLRINSGGPTYTDTNGSLFVADRAYAPGSFGYVGGLEHTFSQPIGGTDDDPLYQDVRVGREADGDGIFSYRFDVPLPGLYDVTLYLVAPAFDPAGNVVMDVKAEQDVVYNDLDVTAEAGGNYQALVKTFAVEVNDGTLDLRFRAVNKAAVVSAIAVEQQKSALNSENGAAGGRDGS